MGIRAIPGVAVPDNVFFLFACKMKKIEKIGLCDEMSTGFALERVMLNSDTLTKY